MFVYLYEKYAIILSVIAGIKKINRTCIIAKMSKWVKIHIPLQVNACCQFFVALFNFFANKVFTVELIQWLLIETETKLIICSQNCTQKFECFVQQVIINEDLKKSKTITPDCEELLLHSLATILCIWTSSCIQKNSMT